MDNIRQIIISILAEGPMDYDRILEQGRVRSNNFYGQDMLREIYFLMNNDIILRSYLGKDPSESWYGLTMPVQEIEKILLLC